MKPDLYTKAVLTALVLLLAVIAYRVSVHPSAAANGVQGAQAPAHAPQASQQTPQTAAQATTPTGGNTQGKAAIATLTKCPLGQIPAPQDVPELKGTCVDKVKLVHYEANRSVSNVQDEYLEGIKREREQREKQARESPDPVLWPREAHAVEQTRKASESGECNAPGKPTCADYKAKLLEEADKQ